MDSTLTRLIVTPFTKGSFASILFIVVMWICALLKNTNLVKILYPLRGRLAIIACIFVFTHNLLFVFSNMAY